MGPGESENRVVAAARHAVAFCFLLPLELLLNALQSYYDSFYFVLNMPFP